MNKNFKNISNKDENFENKYVYSPTVKAAIRFSIKTHEVYQKQKRKGKDIPYITHPLIVGLLIARAGGDDYLIAAGILHDTIEDSTSQKKVTREMLAKRFGERIAKIVDDVSENPRIKNWEQKKLEAISRIEKFSRDSLLVKAADVLANSTELLNDYQHHGREIFTRFSAPAEKVIWYYLTASAAILKKSPGIPFFEDLKKNVSELEKIKI